MAESQVKSLEVKVDFDEDDLEVIAQVPAPGPDPCNEKLDLDDETLKGASACEQLQCYDDAISSCEKGLVIDKTSKTLMHLRARSVGDRVRLQEAKSNSETYAAKGQHVLDSEVGDRSGEGPGDAYQSLTKVIEGHERELKIAKELGDRAKEGISYCNLGNAYESQGDFRKAIEYHKLDLEIAKELGDRPGEGISYCNLGNAYESLGDFKKAIECYEIDLEIAKEVGDRAGEGKSYANLGNAYDSLGDFQKAIEYHKRDLAIAKEVGDKAGEGISYCNLGSAYESLGDFKKAIECYEIDLEIAKKLGDRAGEGKSYANLGNAYDSLGDFRKAIEYHEQDLKICKEGGDRAGEGMAYGNLGNAYHSLGDVKKAIEYHEQDLKICTEGGDRAGEGMAYGNLGNAYYSLGDFKKAIEYDELDLKIAKEVGDKVGIAISFCKLGRSFESLKDLERALDYYRSSVRMLDNIREQLQGKDEWTISFRHISHIAYTKLWCLMLKRGEVVEALFAADEGRAQALKDLLNSKYESETSQTTEESTSEKLRYLQSNVVFMALHEREIFFWIIKNGKDVQVRKKEIGDNNSKENATNVLKSLIDTARKEIGVRSPLNIKSDGDLSKKHDQTISQPTNFGTNPLRTWYDLVISPIEDLIDGNELIFVPEGPLCLAPYAAFMDSNSKYLSESFRIRVIPSLKSLKLIKDCSPDYHQKSGSLLVGNPCYEDVGLEMLYPLPCAKEEVEMIGKILKTTPLIGEEATKDEVMKRLPTVDLVHIAAHGRMETGEIYLAPNPKLASQTPVEEDLLLTKSDVVRVPMRARLVVLSCCYSGRGEIKAEGVVGIARAFLGADARSVLVSLWAIDDEATLEFMESFYLHLTEGGSASESLNRAMKCLRESEKFSKVMYWAPFVLIGDDVTLDLAKAD